MELTDAIKLIAVNCPSIQREAIKTLRAGAGTLQMRYNWLVEQALDDPEARFTPAERAALIELVEPLDADTQSEVIRCRVTPAEKARAQARADAESGGNLSDLVRHLLFD
jgi:hypothetical protein